MGFRAIFLHAFGGLGNLKGPRTRIIGFWGPNTINSIVFGP